MLVNTRTADVLRTTVPTASLPMGFVDALNEATLEDIRDIARYAEVLADHKE